MEEMKNTVPVKGNVLVVGNSGVGKSTLINAVLGENVAYTSCGTKGTTVSLHIYDKEESPFRLIDTIGFEPTFFKKEAAIGAVRKWSRECGKVGHEDNQINVIWFCVDGTARKLFTDTVKSLASAVKVWKGVPVIAVITKSYSVPDREENIQMVYEAFAEQKSGVSLKAVIPVVAQDYVINEGMSVAPNGIAELIDKTNDLMPDGLAAGHEAVEKMVLERNRSLSQGSVFFASAAAAGVGLVPIPVPDSTVLVPLETTMINGIAKIYGITDKEQGARFAQSLIEAGAVTVAAEGIIKGLKAIPGINLAASVINAITAGVLCTALGELTVMACEKVYRGEETLGNLDWIKAMITPALLEKLNEKSAEVLKAASEASGKVNVGKLIGEIFGTGKKK